MSMRTIARSGRGFDGGDGFASSAGGQDRHAATFQHAGEGEDIADVVVDDEHLAAEKRFVGLVQAVEHALLVRRQVGHHAMQEQRGFIQQPLGRFDIFDHHAARQHVQAGILFGAEFAAGEHHHRQVLQLFVVAQLIENFEAAHVGQAQVEHRAVVAGFLEPLQSGRSGIDHVDVDVVVPEQFANAELLGGIVFHHEQALAARQREVANAGERRFQALGGSGFGDEGEGAAREAVAAIVVEGEHLHRNVAGARILLEVVEDGPAEHVGQEDVEGDGGGIVFTGQGQRFGAGHGAPEP